MNNVLVQSHDFFTFLDYIHCGESWDRGSGILFGGMHISWNEVGRFRSSSVKLLAKCKRLMGSTQNQM